MPLDLHWTRSRGVQSFASSGMLCELVLLRFEEPSEMVGRPASGSYG